MYLEQEKRPQETHNEKERQKEVQGGWGEWCNKAENEERHKREEAEGGQTHHMLSAAFKDGWDRWQLQTISLRRTASFQEEIRDPFVHPLPPAMLCLRCLSCSVLCFTPLKCVWSESLAGVETQTRVRCSELSEVPAALCSHYGSGAGLISFKPRARAHTHFLNIH